MKIALVFIIISILFTSCLKEKAVDAVFSELQLPSDLSINKIILKNDSIWAAAGLRFGKGAVFFRFKVLDSDHEIRSLKFVNNRLYVISIGNTLYWSDNIAQSWNNIQMPGWEYFSDAAFFNNYRGLLCGGENFGKGILHELSTGIPSVFVKADTIQNEISAIESISDSVFIAVGFGVILRTSDFGVNWVPDKARGDFFKSLSFPNNQNGYVAGDYGSIYKTIDAGLNWKKIRSASTFFNTKNRFNAIHFKNIDEGAVCGVKGLLWFSRNAAESWIPILGLPELNLYSLALSDDYIFAGSENGKIFKIEIP